MKIPRPTNGTSRSMAQRHRTLSRARLELHMLPKGSGSFVSFRACDTTYNGSRHENKACTYRQSESERGVWWCVFNRYKVFRGGSSKIRGLSIVVTVELQSRLVYIQKPFFYALSVPPSQFASWMKCFCASVATTLTLYEIFAHDVDYERNL